MQPKQTPLILEHVTVGFSSVELKLFSSASFSASIWLCHYSSPMIISRFFPFFSGIGIAGFSLSIIYADWRGCYGYFSILSLQNSRVFFLFFYLQIALCKVRISVVILKIAVHSNFQARSAPEPCAPVGRLGWEKRTVSFPYNTRSRPSFYEWSHSWPTPKCECFVAYTQILQME